MASRRTSDWLDGDDDSRGVSQNNRALYNTDCDDEDEDEAAEGGMARADGYLGTSNPPGDVPEAAAQAPTTSSAKSKVKSLDKACTKINKRATDGQRDEDEHELEGGGMARTDGHSGRSNPSGDTPEAAGQASTSRKTNCEVKSPEKACRMTKKETTDETNKKDDASKRRIPPEDLPKNFVITENSGITNCSLHQKCLFLCVAKELKMWNVDVHCSSLVKFWTRQLEKHCAENGTNPSCRFGDKKEVTNEIRRLQNDDNLGEESIIVLAMLLGASITVFEINPLGDVTIKDGSGKSATVSVCGVFNDIQDVTQIYILQSGLKDWRRKAASHFSRVHPAGKDTDAEKGSRGGKRMTTAAPKSKDFAKDDESYDQDDGNDKSVKMVGAPPPIFRVQKDGRWLKSCNLRTPTGWITFLADDTSGVQLTSSEPSALSGSPTSTTPSAIPGLSEGRASSTSPARTASRRPPSTSGPIGFSGLDKASPREDAERGPTLAPERKLPAPKSKDFAKEDDSNDHKGGNDKSVRVLGAPPAVQLTSSTSPAPSASSPRTTPSTFPAPSAARASSTSSTPPAPRGLPSTPTSSKPTKERGCLSTSTSSTSRASEIMPSDRVEVAAKVVTTCEKDEGNDDASMKGERREDTPLCDVCDAKTATKQCNDCKKIKVFCDECNICLHSSGTMQGHTRKDIHDAPASGNSPSAAERTAPDLVPLKTASKGIGAGDNAPLQATTATLSAKGKEYTVTHGGTVTIGRQSQLEGKKKADIMIDPPFIDKVYNILTMSSKHATVKFKTNGLYIRNCMGVSEHRQVTVDGQIIERDQELQVDPTSTHIIRVCEAEIVFSPSSPSSPTSQSTSSSTSSPTGTLLSTPLDHSGRNKKDDGTKTLHETASSHFLKRGKSWKSVEEMSREARSKSKKIEENKAKAKARLAQTTAKKQAAAGKRKRKDNDNGAQDDTWSEFVCPSTGMHMYKNKRTGTTKQFVSKAEYDCWTERRDEKTGKVFYSHSKSFEARLRKPSLGPCKYHESSTCSREDCPYTHSNARKRAARVLHEDRFGRKEKGSGNPAEPYSNRGELKTAAATIFGRRSDRLEKTKKNWLVVFNNVGDPKMPDITRFYNRAKATATEGKQCKDWFKDGALQSLKAAIDKLGEPDCKYYYIEVKDIEKVIARSEVEIPGQVVAGMNSAVQRLNCAAYIVLNSRRPQQSQTGFDMLTKVTSQGVKTYGSYKVKVSRLTNGAFRSSAAVVQDGQSAMKHGDAIPIDVGKKITKDAATFEIRNTSKEPMKRKKSVEREGDRKRQRQDKHLPENRDTGHTHASTARKESTSTGNKMDDALSESERQRKGRTQKKDDKAETLDSATDDLEATEDEESQDLNDPSDEERDSADSVESAENVWGGWVFPSEPTQRDDSKKEEAVHFSHNSKGELGKLSVMSPMPIIAGEQRKLTGPNGHLFHHVSGVYQASKDPSNTTYINAVNVECGFAARRVGISVRRSRQWQAAWKRKRVKIMYVALMEYFELHDEARHILIKTWPKYLTFSRKPTDEFWGMALAKGEWVGENKLGILLMNIRLRVLKKERLLIQEKEVFRKGADR